MLFIMQQVITSISISGASNYAIKMCATREISLADYYYVRKLAAMTCLVVIFFCFLYFIHFGSLKISIFYLLNWFLLSYLMTILNVNNCFFQGFSLDNKSLYYSFMIFLIFITGLVVSYIFTIQHYILTGFIITFISIVLFFSSKDVTRAIGKKKSIHNVSNINTFNIKDYLLNFLSNSIVMPVFFILGYLISEENSLNESLSYNVLSQLRNIILIAPVVFLQYTITQSNVIKRLFFSFTIYSFSMFVIGLFSAILIINFSSLFYGNLFDDGAKEIYLMCFASSIAGISSFIGNIIFMRGGYFFSLVSNLAWAITVLVLFYLKGRYDTISAFESLIIGYSLIFFISCVYLKTSKFFSLKYKFRK